MHRLTKVRWILALYTGLFLLFLYGPFVVMAILS